MSTKVDLSDKAVVDAIDRILSQQTQCTESTNPWLLLTHAGLTNKIRVAETGDSFDEFIDELSEGRIMYGLMKFNIHGVYKVAFISWCPDGVDGVTKGKFGVWNKDMEGYLKGKYHTQVMARQEEDIDRQQMIQKFKVATGSSYATTGVKVNERNTVNTAKQSISVQQEQIKSGAGVQRTVSDYRDEHLKKESEQFWSKQQQQQEQQQKSTTTNTRSELSQIKQQSEQFWSQHKDQPSSSSTGASTTGSAREELAHIKQQSNQFWQQQQQQQQESNKTSSSVAAPSIKADVSALRNKFAQQAQVSEPSHQPPPQRPAPSSGGVSSLRDRFAQQQQQQQQQEEEEEQEQQVLPPVPSSATTQQSRLPPPPSFGGASRYDDDEEEQEEEQQQYQQEEEEQYQPEPEPVLPPVPTMMTPPNMIPPNMVNHDDEDDDGFDEPEPASTYQVPSPTGANGEPGVKYRAMYDFETEDKEELSFFEEDILIVVESEGDWWRAYRQADISKNVGLVPANYLEPC